MKMKTITRMKQIVLALALTSPQLTWAADIDIKASFPDVNVQNVLLSSSYDRNQDGILSDEEQSSFTSLSLNNKGVTDLTGVNLLTQLQSLNVSRNAELTSIDIKALVNLTSLDVSNTGLVTLDISGLSKVTNLYANKCTNLTTVIADGCSSLNYIYDWSESGYPALTTLSLKGTAFTSFSVYHNKIESVDMGDCTKMTSFTASGMENLSSLNILGCTELTSLKVTKNKKLVNLNVSNLEKLTSLDISNSEALDNPVLKGLTALTSFNADNTPGLKTLNVGDMPALESFSITNTGLTTLDIRGLSKVTSLYANKCANLTTIIADGCSSLNYIYDWSESGYPALTTLSLNGTAFTSFSVYHNKIESVDMGNCPNLTSFTASSTDNLSSLNILGCTELTSLKVTKNKKLVNLNVSNLEKLTSLDISNSEALDNPVLKGLTALTSFKADNTPGLKTLSVGDMPALESFSISNTGLTTLDIRGLSNVTSLYANKCAYLTTLIADGCSSLNYIYDWSESGYPALTTLSLKGTAFTSFSVYHDKIESVDMSDCTQMTSFTASGTENLSSLNIAGCTELTSLTVTRNKKLVNLNVSNLKKLTSLDISNSEALDNPVLEGLTALTSFKADNTPGLKTLVVGDMPALESFSISNTGLTMLDIRGLSKVTSLYANKCAYLTTIIADGCSSLNYIYDWSESGYPALTTLNLRGTAFTSFSVYHDKIESVDMSDCTKMTSFTASGAENLASLKLDGCTALTSLTITNNPLISSFDVDDSKLPALKSFTITKLPLLETLTVKSSTLTSLSCYRNTLKSLDVTQCPELTSLDCSYNQLTSLDLSKNTKLSSATTDQHNIDTDIVFLSATQVGFVINDGFNAANVVEFSINSDKKEPAYATLDGVKYFLVYDNAADAEEFLTGKTIRYGYDTGLAGYPLNNKLNITGYTKAPSFLKVNPESVKGVYGSPLAAPELIRSQDYNGAVSYISANENVVKVAADGKLTVVGAGETTVTLSGVETEYRLAPADVTYAVVIEKASPVFKFEKAALEMVINEEVPANALNKGVYDGTVVYTSSDETVAKIAANGKVTVIAAGEVTLTAKGEATANCNAPTAASYKLTIKKQTATLTIASTTVEGVYGGKINAPALTLNGYDGKPTYASSNEDVIKVAADGKLTIKGAGEAVITISATETANYYAPANVTYTVKIAKASPTFSFEEESLKVNINETVPENKLSVGIYDGTVTYSSSDATIAEVDAATGAVTLKKVGEVTITATGAATANCNAASATYKLEVTIKGDVNGDGSVDVADIGAIIDVMAKGSNDAIADVNGDGSVDVADIGSVIDIMAELARLQRLMMEE